MPRLGELEPGLRMAIVKHYGRDPKKICREVGLVPFREWNFIERQHDLMITLRDYLDVRYGGDYTAFPQYVRLRKEGQLRLFRLVQDFGGRRFVAERFGMRHRRPTPTPAAVNGKNGVGAACPEMNWGPFDLEFGIALLGFVRRQQMRLEPPLRHPVIAMPTREQLLLSSSGEDGGGSGDDEGCEGTTGAYLDQKIVEYGGYENVARRLGLEYFVPGR